MKTCCYCEEKLTKRGESRRTVEHLLPTSKGGGDHPANLFWCCSRCNTWRSNTPLPVWAKDVRKYQEYGRAPFYTQYHIDAMLKNIELLQEYLQEKEPLLRTSPITMGVGGPAVMAAGHKAKPSKQPAITHYYTKGGNPVDLNMLFDLYRAGRLEAFILSDGALTDGSSFATIHITIKPPANEQGKTNGI